MPKRKHSPFIVCPFEIKAVDETTDKDNFIVEGMASPYGNIDSYRDIVMPGSFTTSLLKRGPHRSILWQHRSSEPIGRGEMKDETAGLACRIKLPKEDTFVTGRVMPQVKAKSVQGLSIGYQTVKEEYDRETNINRLIEIDLREVSLVTFPANELAQITAAKEFIKSFESDELSGNSYKEYPLADDKTEYDKLKTFESLKKTLTLESENYEKCFLIQNGEKSQLPYVDFIKGDLKIIPSAIYSAAAGFIIGKSDNSEAIDFINKIYAKMGQEIPFQENNVFVDHKTYEALKKQDLTAIFNSYVILSNSVKNLIVKELGSPGGSVQNDNSDFLSELKTINKSIGDM